MTDRIALGEQVMSALDKRGISHGYYSVSRHGISVDVNDQSGKPGRLVIYPLLTELIETTWEWPAHIGFFSRDLTRVENVHLHKSPPEWAAYLGWWELPSY